MNYTNSFIPNRAARTQQRNFSLGAQNQPLSLLPNTRGSIPLRQLISPNRSLPELPIAGASASILRDKIMISEEAFYDGRQSPSGFRGPVVFRVTPQISESKSANYIEESGLRAAASLIIYSGSPSRDFNLNIKLVSRTKDEAVENFRILHRMKGWPQPTKGGNSIDSDAPSILYLHGYGRQFKAIKCIAKSLNIEYPTDCDYISIGDGDGTKMPIIMPINLSLQEIRSGEELSKFDLSAYKNGNLVNW